MDILSSNEPFNQYLNSLDINDELEISFQPKLSKLTLEKYRTLLQYFAKSEYTVETSDTLNVLYNYDHDYYNMYRISVDGNDNIDNVVNNMSKEHGTNRENHVVFLLLHEQLKAGKREYLSGMDKKKSKDDIHDINELGIRIRKSRELPMPDDIEVLHTERNYIKHRYIQRASLIIEDNKSYTIRVDLSYVKTSDKLIVLDRANAVIELEIDVSVKKALKKVDKDAIKNTMIGIYSMITKVLQKSNAIVTVAEREEVIVKMKELLIPNEQGNMRDLPAMRPVSAELQHVVDYVGHEHCVTDKADGDHYFLFVVDDTIMLVSDGLEVKKVDGYNNVSTFNNTILEGEYIFSGEHQKFMFLAFDCLFFKGEDKRPNKNLVERLECIREITRDVFGQKNSFSKYDGEFDYAKMQKYYETDMKKNLKELNKLLNSKGPINVISMKYHAIPQGIHLCEIFFLTNILWQLYTTDKEANCPYTLDGCIWVPLQQHYTRVLSEYKKKIYKLKFEKHNSMDLYTTFERDPVSNHIIDIYDDSEAYTNNKKVSEAEFAENIEFADEVEMKPKGQLYRIAYLHVGKKSGDNEFPVLFHEATDEHYVHLYLKDGEPRDINGNIIQDKTVVEYTYENNPSLKQGNKWIPLRTRYDKTESVNTYKRRYGNNSVIAERVWQSMIDGVEETDIELLANVNTYDDHHKKLRSRITSTMIEQERRENAYYNYNNKMAASLRHYHNWVKSSLIYTYCGQQNDMNGQYKMNVLDYSCGVGGDIGKFLSARLSTYVGFDLDYAGIHSGSDGAISRFQSAKKRMGVIAFPMKFFVADGGAPLTVKDQLKAVGKIDDNNTNIITTLFDTPKPKLYDVVSCQFAVHYFFKNENTLEGFLHNMKTFTKPSAYAIFTTFDADLVDADLQKGDITSHITTPEGDKKIVFDVKKRYEGKVQNITGQALDVHLPAFDEDKYVVEYLVPKKLFVDKMKSIGFRLVDTDMFWNTFHKHKNFFDTAVQEEEKAAMKKYYMGVKEYFNMEDIANQSYYPFTQKNRYYVFQKETDINEMKSFTKENIFVPQKNKKKITKKK